MPGYLLPRLRKHACPVKILLGVVIACCALSSDAHAQLRAEVFVSGLSNPVAFIPDPSDPAVQYVVEQAGRIRVIRNGTLLSSDFLNLSTQIATGGERGLL